MNQSEVGLKSLTAPLHMSSLKMVGALTSVCGRMVSVWELGIKPGDTVVSEWAKNFRQSYCSDNDIDSLRLDLTRKDYLKTMVFPHPTQKPGPSIRSGDFAELLMSDFLEHIGGYWVPRFKYQDKASPNESVKGSDVLGFHQAQSGIASPNDALVVCEVKAQLTGKKYNDRLQDAVDDSSKDVKNLRIATSLNALKRRALAGKLQDKVDLIERFQRKTDLQFVLKSSAAAILTNEVYDAIGVASVDCAKHVNSENLELIVVKGNQLMLLVHELYEVAANEA